MDKPTNGTDIKDVTNLEVTQKRFNELLDASNTLLKETFPFGYKFVQKLKKLKMKK